MIEEFLDIMDHDDEKQTMAQDNKGLISNDTLLAHAKEFDYKAKEILFVNPKYVTDDPIQRAIEYSDLAYSFRKLVN